MSRITPCRIAVVTFIVLVATSCCGQRGVLTSSRDLAQLTDSAATIVRGRIVLSRVEPHPVYKHLSTVVVILRAEEVLKGAPERTYTFRQFIFDIRDRRDGAGYHKGDEFLLLMNPPNRLGLTSPVGLAQGRFRIVHNNNRKAYAVNGYDNRGLFQTTSSKTRFEAMPRSLAAIAAEHQGGPIALDDLRGMIRQLSLHP